MDTFSSPAGSDEDILEHGGLTGFEDVEDIVADTSLAFDKKSEILQKVLFAASSNGDVSKVKSLLGGGANVAQYVDVNAKDDKGSTALIYSACFGHEAVVNELLKFGALTDEADNHEWTSLMWAINNKHLNIVKTLLENGADLNISTSSGRTAVNFVKPQDDIYQYLKKGGYIEEDDERDFYQEMKDPTHLEDEFSRKLEESASALDTDMANLTVGGAAVTGSKAVGYGIFNDVDVNPASDDDTDDDIADIEDYTYGDDGFLWERCLPDQMFVFTESDIPKILDHAITQVSPQRSGRQKPIPANMIFLCARYANYFGSSEMLTNLLEPVISRIKSAMVEHKGDIAFLAFWLSNCSLLLYYCRKDPGVKASTKDFQTQLGELIGDLYVLITQDVEVRLDKILDASILDHETIPGLDAIHYQSDWAIFRRKNKILTHKEEVDQVTRPPSPKRKAQPSPRMVTSILSSVLFMMDLYEVHPVISQEIISQILYWLGSTLFNRIMMNKKYLARSRAMQIRLNVSAIEDWTRANNRRPKDADEFGLDDQKKPYYKSTLEICSEHFASLTQILQWLQCFTGFGEDFTNVIATLQQLTALYPMQLLHVANKYRAEVGENGLSKEYKKYLADLQSSYDRQQTHVATVDVAPGQVATKAGDDQVVKDDKEEKKDDKEKKEKDDEEKGQDHGEKSDSKTDKTNVEGEKEDIKQEHEVQQPKDQDLIQETLPEPPRPEVKLNLISQRLSEDEPRQTLYLDAAKVLSFILPTQQEMIITWGAGLGGTHKKRARKHEPVLPADFLDRFEDERANGMNSNLDSALSTGINPLFGDLTVPQPSAHKGWGEDPEIDDLNGGWGSL